MIDELEIKDIQWSLIDLFDPSGVEFIVGYTRYKIGLILGLRPANERRRYKVTASLIGWAQTYISPVKDMSVHHFPSLL